MRRALEILAAGGLLTLGACSGQTGQGPVPSTPPVADTLPAPDDGPVDAGVQAVHFADTAAFAEYLAQADSANLYSEGILPDIARHSLAYADSIVNSIADNFIIIDKGGMKLRLYDRYGRELRRYSIACSKHYGARHEKGDNRTPEGFFRVKGIFDSTDWLYTDDDGHTSPVKGQYGPRFIRISPAIGVHGTCAPWSIGRRVSHGCIRVTNENILELVTLVERGTPVIIVPGLRDVEANDAEGHTSVWVPPYKDAVEPRKAVVPAQPAPAAQPEVVEQTEQPEAEVAAEPTVPEEAEGQAEPEKPAELSF